MSYQVVIKRSAEKELDALPKSRRERVVRRRLSLEGDPRPPGSKKLQGQESYRLRMGDYRALYTINDQGRRVTVTPWAIGVKSIAKILRSRNLL